MGWCWIRFGEDDDSELEISKPIQHYLKDRIDATRDDQFKDWYEFGYSIDLLDVLDLSSQQLQTFREFLIETARILHDTDERPLHFADLANHWQGQLEIIETVIEKIDTIDA